MITLNVTLRSGQTRVIQARTGVSLMETLRENGIDEILAICGGCCSCATCHVYVAPTDWDRLPPAGDEELALIAFTEHLTERSRLSCQIKTSLELDGLSVTIAPED